MFNPFIDIISGKASCVKVYEDEQFLAFHDIYPVAPVHILLIPKKYFLSFDDFVANNSPELVGTFFKLVRKIANDAGLADDGYRVVTNHGKNAHQTVPHFHVHIIGGGLLREPTA